MQFEEIIKKFVEDLTNLSVSKEVLRDYIFPEIERKIFPDEPTKDQVSTNLSMKQVDELIQKSTDPVILEHIARVFGSQLSDLTLQSKQIMLGRAFPKDIKEDTRSVLYLAWLACQ